MQKVKKSWNASGNRHATSRGAKEKPRVSQFDILNPVMQLAGQCISSIPEITVLGLTHLDDDELSSAVHLTRLGLPNASCRRVRPCTQSCYDASYHHTGDRPAAGLYYRPDSNDG